MTHSANGPWDNSLNFNFPTKHVIPESLKFSHSEWDEVIWLGFKRGLVTSFQSYLVRCQRAPTKTAIVVARKNRVASHKPIGNKTWRIPSENKIGDFVVLVLTDMPVTVFNNPCNQRGHILKIWAPCNIIHTSLSLSDNISSVFGNF